jgi:hypothetical protein
MDVVPTALSWRSPANPYYWLRMPPSLSSLLNNQPYTYPCWMRPELQLVLRIESTCLQALHTAAGLPASCDWTSHHTSRLKRPCEPHYLPLPALNGRGSHSSKLEEPCKPHCWLLMLAHLSSSLNNQPYFDSRSLPLVGF